MLPLKTILHPTDFSASAEHALEIARALARDHGARLVLLAAPAPPLPTVELYVPEAELTELIEESKQRLATAAAQITEAPVETRVVVGDPGRMIVTVAQDCGADLIVMGTHGRTGVARLLLGSIAEYVLRHAPCPVLTVKSERAAESADVAAAASGIASL